MADYISHNLTTIVLAVIALFAGIAIAIRIRVSRRSSRRNISTRVSQSNNRVGGDQAGRDINKH